MNEVVVPAALLGLHQPDQMPDQFLLGRLDTVPAGWEQRSLHGWTLGSHPSLPVMEVMVADAAAGWLLGYPVHDRDGLLTAGDRVALAGWEQPQVNQLLWELGGRYLLLLVHPRCARVFPDPVGSLSCVYSAHHRMVAATPLLIPYCEDCGDQEDLIRQVAIPDSGANYPLGMLPRADLERLLPNHSLSLTAWEADRIWPGPGPMAKNADSAAVVAEIARIVSHQLAAIAAKFELQLGLTAGQDSRLILACARAVRRRLVCYTLDLGDPKAELDCFCARAVARQAGVPHRRIGPKPPLPADYTLWLYRTGCSVGEPGGWRIIDQRRALDPDRVELVGLVGELGRAFYGNLAGIEPDSALADRLLECAAFPRTSAARQRIQVWLQEFAQLDPIDRLDLYYLEQRLGAWGGVWPYAEAGAARFIFFPLAHRRVVELMFALPLAYLRGGTLSRDVIASVWPELNGFPVNTPFGSLALRTVFRKALGMAGKVLRDPMKYVRKVGTRGRGRRSTDA